MEYQKQLDAALELYEADKIQESASILLSIYQDIPVVDAGSLRLAGTLLRAANELPEALDCYQRLLELYPISPRDSLGWFHSLWRSERYDEAFDELARFFSINDSRHQKLLIEDGEHLRLLEEMRDEFFGESLYKNESPLKLIELLKNDFQQNYDYPDHR